MNRNRNFLCLAIVLISAGIFLEDAPAQVVFEDGNVILDDVPPALDEAPMVLENDGSCFDCCEVCLPVWTVRGEGLAFWTQGDQLPPLLTTAPVGTPANQAGNLGNAQTQILFGNEEVNDGSRGGYRFTLGRCIGDGMELEASYLGLPELTTNRHDDSNSRPILSRPFFNVSTGLNDHQAVAFPGSFTGSIDIEENSEFHSVSLIGKKLFLDRAGGFYCARVNVFAGYRYLRLDEDLRIESSSTVVGGGGVLVPGTQLDVQESFSAENSFHGADLGIVAECAYGEFSWELTGRAALGNSRGIFAIDGSTTTTVPAGGAAVTAGGLLAQPTNIGVFEQNQFAIVPELGIKLRYAARPGLRATIGYNFIYWSDVLRPGSHIDTALNLSQAGGGALVGAARPAFTFEDDNFWAHGISFGVDYHF